MAGDGGFVGWLYFGWAAFVLLGCLGMHQAYALLYLLAMRGSWPRSALVLEVIYGLLNPVLYLLVLQPVLFRVWTPSWLAWLSWFALVAVWVCRLQLVALPGPWVRGLLIGTFVLLVAVSVRDASAFFTGAQTVPDKATSNLAHWLTALLCAPLYVLPLMILSRWLRPNATDDARATTEPRGLPRRVRLALVAFGALIVLSTLPHPSRARVRGDLLAHRETILRVSKERQLDPRLLAALAEVTQREYQTPFRAVLETAATDAWLFDSKSGLLLAEAIDPSLGLTQVKANTLLTAYAIVFLSPGAPSYLSKDYRSVRFLSEQELARLPRPELQHVRVPSEDTLPGKDEVVAAVKTPEGNLAAAAFLLDVYASQWELADPRWSIRDKPDILATLFQIGFARSVPKADPRSNDFGKRVAEAMQDPWMVQHFGARGDKSP